MEGMGLHTLKSMMFEQIRQQLSWQNILDEISSPFTLMFEEVEQLELKFFDDHWVRLWSYQCPERRLKRPYRPIFETIKANYIIKIIPGFDLPLHGYHPSGKIETVSF